MYKKRKGFMKVMTLETPKLHLLPVVAHNFYLMHNLFNVKILDCKYLFCINKCSFFIFAIKNKYYFCHINANIQATSLFLHFYLKYFFPFLRSYTLDFLKNASSNNLSLISIKKVMFWSCLYYTHNWKHEFYEFIISLS